MIKLYVMDEAAMLTFGHTLAQYCPRLALIFLQGELGVGKTTLVRGFLRGLGYTGKVKSPTYTLVEPYQLQQHIVYHFDLYRIRSPQELVDMGLDDYLTQAAILLIEWPEQAADLLPTPDLTCYIEHATTGRVIKLEAKQGWADRFVKNVQL